MTMPVQQPLLSAAADLHTHVLLQLLQHLKPKPKCSLCRQLLSSPNMQVFLTDTAEYVSHMPHACCQLALRMRHMHHW